MIAATQTSYELKPAYFRQAVKNLDKAARGRVEREESAPQPEAVA